jgi:hypothetical protein
MLAGLASNRANRQTLEPAAATPAPVDNIWNDTVIAGFASDKQYVV